LGGGPVPPWPQRRTATDVAPVPLYVHMQWLCVNDCMIDRLPGGHTHTQPRCCPVMRATLIAPSRRVAFAVQAWNYWTVTRCCCELPPPLRCAPPRRVKRLISPITSRSPITYTCAAAAADVTRAYKRPHADLQSSKPASSKQRPLPARSLCCLRK